MADVPATTEQHLTRASLLEPVEAEPSVDRPGHGGWWQRGRGQHLQPRGSHGAGELRDDVLQPPVDRHQDHPAADLSGSAVRRGHQRPAGVDRTDRGWRVQPCPRRHGPTCQPLAALTRVEHAVAGNQQPAALRPVVGQGVDAVALHLGDKRVEPVELLLAAQMGEMANRAAPQLAQGLMDGGQPA